MSPCRSALGKTSSAARDGGGHCAEVHWHVGRLRHHVALGIEDGARKIAAFLDVGRV